jgi:hypothetical protein
LKGLKNLSIITINKDLMIMINTEGSNLEADPAIEKGEEMIEEIGIREIIIRIINIAQEEIVERGEITMKEMMLKTISEGILSRKEI